MANITVTTNQNIIEVTESGGVDVTNTTNEITILPSGTLIIQGPDTYSINASTATGGANLNLLNSNGTNDAVKIASGTNVTVSRTDADTISIASTDTNTTYTQNASSVAGGANLNLVGSDSTTDSVKFASGTGITVSRTDADTITITNTVVGDVVGPASATDNAVARFDTTTGKLIQNSTAILNDTGDLSIAGDLTVTGQNISTGVTDSIINIDRTTTSTTAAQRALILRAITNGTPVAGFGTRLEFQAQTGVSTFKQAGNITVESSNVTSGSETFDMRFGLMRAGAAASSVLSIFGDTGDVVMARGGEISIRGLTTGSTNIGAPDNGSTLTYVLPGAQGAASSVLTNDGAGTLSWTTNTNGDVVGPASATDNAVARFDTTTGKLIQNSTVTIDDSGNIISNGLTLTTPLAVSSGGTGRAVGNYSIYANEIHVGKDGNDSTGDGTLINPVLTITKALTLIGAGRNTVVVHPGTYSESPTVSSANTTIATAELTGANTQISGTLTLSAAARVSGIKLTNLTITGSGNTYISNCTVDTQVIKSGSNYVEIINSELQCTLGIQITGAGTVSIVGNKCWAVAISNASANVLIKDCFQVITPSVTAGTLQIDGSAIFAASPSSNAVTSSASSFITLANSFVLNSVGTSVERVSLSGFYSILNLVYDKPNSTLVATSGTGGNLNAIDYFSVVNADTLAGTSGLTLSTVGSNGNITLTPNGTGDIVVTLANGGNLTNSRNYVFGAIRNATTESNGDIWAVNASSSTLPVRGISMDNVTDFASKNAGTVIRNYSNIGGFGPRLVFERARYSSTPATPATLNSGDTIGIIQGTGYSSTLGWVNDTLSLVPAFASFSTSEAWASNTNLGTQFNLQLAPSATTLTTAGNLVPVITANPQTFACRSDAYTWSNGKTGTTQRMSLDVSGNLTVSAGITSTTGNIVATAGSISTTAGEISANGVFDVNQAFSSTANMLDTNTVAGSSVGITTNYWTSSAKTTRTVPQSGNKLGNFRFNSYSDASNTFALGPEVLAEATENWTGSANGARLVFAANKAGQSWTTGHVICLKTSPDATDISSDIITLENSAGTDYAVFNSTSATFSQPVGFPVKTAAQWNAITGAVGRQVSVSDSPTAGGRMAFWDTTNARWSYISDNTAV